MKHEWKKNEKQFYLPKNEHELISIPEFKFFTIEGNGNPNDDFFAEYIGVLYSLSYGIKMSRKKGTEPEGYFDYTIYPLEGVWDLNEEAKKSFDRTINKAKTTRRRTFCIVRFVTTHCDKVTSLILET